MKSVFLFLFLLFSLAVQAQQVNHDNSVRFNSNRDSIAFVKLVKTTRTYAKQLHTFNWYADSGRTSDAIYAKFKRLRSRFNKSLRRVLRNSYSFGFDFKGFDNIQCSEDNGKSFRFITWSCPQEGTGFDDSYTLIQYKIRDTIRVHSLSKTINDPYQYGSWSVHSLRPFRDTVLYLAIGIDETSREGNTWIARVFGLDSNGLILSYPAFGNNSSSIVIGKCGRGCENSNKRIVFFPKVRTLTVRLTCCNTSLWKDLIINNHLYHQTEKPQMLAESSIGEITKLHFREGKFRSLRHRSYSK